MGSHRSMPGEPIPEVVSAEAAAWVVRLQGEGRTAATEAAFKVWAQTPAHAAAFSRATEIWELVPGAAGRTPQRAREPRTVARLAALAAVVAVLLAGGRLALGWRPTYATTIGEQRVVVLSDGSRVALNTDSRLIVDYSGPVRRVRLERGEALFDVAKNARRPFIVQAGDEAVRAIGTSFSVRRQGDRVSVTLVRGRVEVSQKAEAQARPVPVAVLEPGQRLTVTRKDGIQLDRPRIETAIAWRQGKIIFEDTALADAVAEVNRYGAAQVIVGDPALAGLRVSGVFQTQQPAEFAEAIAALHHLRIERTDDALVLKR